MMETNLLGHVVEYSNSAVCGLWPGARRAEEDRRALDAADRSTAGVAVGASAC